jgi:hypothetical protein
MRLRFAGFQANPSEPPPRQVGLRLLRSVSASSKEQHRVNTAIQLIKQIVRRLLSQEQRDRIYMRKVRLLSTLFSYDLTRLATLHQSDKWGCHWYTQHYQPLFEKRRMQKLKVLEIGVGGYERPDRGGSSLRMWKYFFPFSEIYGVDIYDKSPLQEERIRIFQGSQADPEFLRKLTNETGPLDIIIDDGSHLNEHVIFTFGELFPKLKEGGFYAIEDTQTSYWPECGGSSTDLDAPQTMLTFFKRLTDGLNYQERLIPGYTPTYYDLNIKAVHFFHNLVIVEKGANTELSNVVVANAIPAGRA